MWIRRWPSPSSLAPILALAGCAAPAPEPSGALPAAPGPDPVVRATEFDTHLADAGTDAVVLDVRDEAAYRAGHLPGAVRVDPATWKSVSLGGESGLGHTGLEHRALWYHRIGSLGIDANDTVFVYDDGRMTHAARVWFLLQHFGAARPLVVNGGFPALAATRSDEELSTEPVEPHGTRFMPPVERSGTIELARRDAVREAVEEGTAQVLDVRTLAEWLGQDLRDNERGGHLPSAIHLPHTALLGPDGQLLPTDVLAQEFAAAGLRPGQPVITHCDGGGRAALAALAAARAGYGPVASYYLSFGDWAADPSCPLVRPDGD